MKKYCVIGSGISYTLSPKIHTKLYELFDEKAEYSVVDIAPENFESTLKSLKADGFNVTKPFKELIANHVYDRSGIGSINTVLWTTKEGFSTDGDGFLFDLKRNFVNAEYSNVLVVGYGGAANAIVHALKGKIYVTGRNKDKARSFALKHNIEVYDGQQVDGLINSAMGYVDGLPKTEFCYDLRYSGDRIANGRYNADGLGMLIAQAIYSYGIFTTKRFDNCEVERLYLKIKECL